MTDRVVPTRPVTHRRVRNHPPVDRHVLEQTRAAAAVPLVITVVVLSVAFTAWRLTLAPEWLLLCLMAAGTTVALAVGFRRARIAATAAHTAKEVLAQQIAGAVEATEKTVQWSADLLCQGDRPPVPDRPATYDSADEVEEAAARLGELQVHAVESLIRVHDDSQAALLLAMLFQMTRREHALVYRSLIALDELQRLTDDPYLLEKLYEADHLVTRMRRLVESKAVLGGESLRRIRKPVSVTEMLRGAVCEVVQFSRVQVVSASVGATLGLPGHVGADLTHLVAELVENALECSDPSNPVVVRAAKVSAGLAVEVEDRGLRMLPEVQVQLNALLANPDRVDVTRLVRNGQIGLLVAAKIAKRHGVLVHLNENVVDGTTALVVVPAKVLVAMSEAPAQSPAPAPVRVRVAAPAAEPARLQPADPGPAGESDGSLPPLPKRDPNQSIPAPAARPQAPLVAPDPGRLAAFHSGQRHARSQTAAQQALGTPPAAHP
ncbi:ATP-binding protein [Streptomyces sp. NPDC001275]